MKHLQITKVLTLTCFLLSMYVFTSCEKEELSSGEKLCRQAISTIEQMKSSQTTRLSLDMEYRHYYLINSIPSTYQAKTDLIYQIMKDLVSFDLPSYAKNHSEEKIQQEKDTVCTECVPPHAYRQLSVHYVYELPDGAGTVEIDCTGAAVNQESTFDELLHQRYKITFTDTRGAYPHWYYISIPVDYEHFQNK